MSQGNLSGRRGDQGRNEGPSRSLCDLPVDVLEQVCRYLDARDVLALSRSCTLLRSVANAPRLWADLTLRAFSYEELPQDLGILSSQNTQLLTAHFRQLTLQRPAFLSDAPRTSEILEYAGSRFRKVLHIDGRRDLNFTTVFRNVPPGHYNVIWRVMLQPGYVRGYCNFRAVFARPAADSRGRTAQPHRRLTLSLSLAKSKPAGEFSATRQPTTTAPAADVMAGRDSACGGCRPAVPQAAARRAHSPPPLPLPPPPPPPPPKWQLRRRLRWLPGCLGAPAGVAPDDEDDDDGRANARVGDEAGGVQGGRVAGGNELGAGSGPGELELRYLEQSGGGLQPRAERPMGQLGSLGAALAGAGGGASGPLTSLYGMSEASPAPAPGSGPGLQQQVGQPRQQSPGNPPLALAQQAHPQQQQQQALPPPAPPPLPQQPQQQQEHPEIEVEPVPAEIPALPPQHQHEQLAALQVPPLGPNPATPPDPARPPPPPHPAQLAVEQYLEQLQLQRARGQLATASAKRNAALAHSSGGGARYVSRLLAPLWGSHAGAWRQLDPAGPLGQGAWQGVLMGRLTVRRRADVHLHSVMVQLRPMNAAQQLAAMPPGEARWRGALVDYVELVPGSLSGLLEGLLPGFLQPRSTPVAPLPELGDMLLLPKV